MKRGLKKIAVRIVMEMRIAHGKKAKGLVKVIFA